MKWVSIQDFGEPAHDGIPELMFAQLDPGLHQKRYIPPPHRAVPEPELQASRTTTPEYFWAYPPFEDAGKPCKNCGDGKSSANGFCCQICEREYMEANRKRQREWETIERQRYERERQIRMNARTPAAIAKSERERVKRIKKRAEKLAKKARSKRLQREADQDAATQLPLYESPDPDPAVRKALRDLHQLLRTNQNQWPRS